MAIEELWVTPPPEATLSFTHTRPPMAPYTAPYSSITDFQHPLPSTLQRFRTGTESHTQIHTSCCLWFDLIQWLLFKIKDCFCERCPFNLEAQSLECWWLSVLELGGGLLNKTWRSVCVFMWLTGEWDCEFTYASFPSFSPLLFNLTCYLRFYPFAVIHTLALFQML